ncbi:MAG: TIGR04283 family arsenosugar biosynthesis glycosyltransferase [Bacteroidota bacterium]|nr:TIGR04283 family arsenosugar biosynthesis glycosyltransferase [Bacteroidota bacterium]
MISIIIPTYNEEESIAKTLNNIQLNGDANLIKEIIVVDGGSTDKTIERASECGVRIIVSQKKGRAAQMNEGAAIASEKILHFIHADSQLPEHFDADVVMAVNKGYEAGCFRLAFNYEHWFLKLNCWFTRFDLSAFHYGDQSLFITRDMFILIHGFNEKFIVFEDLDIILKIKKNCRFIILKQNIITSARKYVENGIFKMQMVFYLMYILKQLGASQQKLVNVLRSSIKQDKI